MYKSIPTYKEGKWTVTDFKTLEDFIDFVNEVFKVPGQYLFDETSYLFNEQATLFNKQGFYCDKPMRSKDFMTYWEDQKNKCRNGVIFINKNKAWYITRDYYMWLNFLPIFDKEEKKYGFAKVRDAQYHMALYELLGELQSKHAAILKKRQIASSYFHMAKIINQYWFEEGSICKIGASLKDYINDKGSWKFLDEYATFLNEHTAWYRPNNPDKVLLWEQKIEVRIDNRKTQRGLRSKIQGASFEKNATTGVGGPCTYFFHEEAGIAPKMDQTYEYIRPAMSSGMMTTGQFIAAGSVGDLDQCEPLKRMIMNPEANGILGVETDLMDDKGTIGIAGLFIPEQWSMPPYIDSYGNSKINDALDAIKTERTDWKRELDPEQYQLRISQKPTNIAEAFAYRKASIFPQSFLSRQLKRIEDKQYSYEFLELERDKKGISATKSKRLPISEFPVNKKRDDICRAPAGALQISRKKQKYLVPRSQMVFLKDLGSNNNVFQEYGWKNTGTLFKSHLISYAIEFIRESIDEELDDNGDVIKTRYGVERIPDKMLITEMLQYYPGLNVDRLVSFAALVAFAKMQQANRGYIKRKEKDKSLDSLDNSQNLYKLSMRPFSNIGRSNKYTKNKKRRNPFKNIK